MVGVPQQGRYVIRGGAVVSVDPGIGILRPGQVLIDHGKILAVAPEVDADGAETIDAAGMIVMPGLIDSHFHMWSSIGRNFIAEGYGYFDAKRDTGDHYLPEDHYTSVLFGAVEALSAGITTVHNWSHNVLSPAHADAELRALRDAMVRARYSYGPSGSLRPDEPMVFADIDRVRDEWFPGGRGCNDLVDLGVNLRGPDYADHSVFFEEMNEARARGLPVSIHAEQGAVSTVDSAELERRGILGPDFLICHYMPASDEDMAAMARTATPLSYAVYSELKLAVAGDPRDALLRFRDAGVTVSLSIDATSVSPVNLFEAMNAVWNLGIPWEGTRTARARALTFAECIEMATINGARALMLGDTVGSLTPGKRADVILIRATDLNLAPVVDVESSVVRSVAPANIDTVLVDGRILKRGGQLLLHDARRLAESATRAAMGVWERAGLTRRFPLSGGAS